MSSQSSFVEERGRFYLAEALFAAFKFQIRCPHCPGNTLKPGFIKDTAGKGGREGQARRQWTCQRSNSKTNLTRCPRASCTEYIDLARGQLQPRQFQDVLERVCQRLQPEQEEYQVLNAYTNPTGTPVAHRGVSSSSHDPSTAAEPSDSHDPSSAEPSPHRDSSLPSAPRKRKAEEELPPLHKAARHAQVQRRQQATGIDATLAESFHTAHRCLQYMVEISKTWQEQYEMMSIFLATSSPRPTPSSTMPPRSSPTQLPRHVPSSYSTVPCTYPDEEVSSLSLDPSLEGTRRVTEPSSSTSASSNPGPLRADVRAAVPSSSAESTKSPQSQLDSDHLFDPLKRAKGLVDLFHRIKNEPGDPTQRRKAIRRQAREEGIQGEFQKLLYLGSRDPPTTPTAPELKCSDRK